MYRESRAEKRRPEVAAAMKSNLYIYETKILKQQPCVLGALKSMESEKTLIDISFLAHEQRLNVFEGDINIALKGCFNRVREIEIESFRSYFMQLKPYINHKMRLFY